MEDIIEDILNDGSMFSFGKYEILFASTLPINEYEDGNRGIQYINGALCDPNCHYEYAIQWKEKGKEISSVDFKMQDDNAKLSTVFGSLPYGLIKKNRTGVGATTLELRSKRNSIIVVPTRSLAYEKAKNSWNEEIQGYSIHYVGGKIKGFNPPHTSKYLADARYKHKKIIVVVDSLPLLLNEIGENHFKDYFIMFDEIDCYQYDSSFRFKMEIGFDCYFKFPKTQRSLVSATVGKFTDPRINAEPIINITFNNPAPRDIVLQETNDVLVTTGKQIKHILEKHPNDKILIAFNLLKRGILPIIKTLPAEIQSKCGVLCSEKNKADVGEFYYDIVDRGLPKQITFMTCTFFVGIDFDEPFHLISVASVKYPFTLLSTDKLQQIAGRCRVEDGLLSESIIYDISNKHLDVNFDTLSLQIISDSRSLMDYYQLQSKVKTIFPKLIQNNNIVTKQDIIEYSRKSYEGSSPVNLVRGTTDGIQISFFNIDNILIQVELLKTLYANNSNLENQLIADGHNVTAVGKIHESKHIGVEITREIDEKHTQNEEEEREGIISLLRECSSIEDRIKLAQSNSNSCMNENSTFLKHFIELQEYVPFDKLVELLPKCNTKIKYSKFKKQIFVWALDENHVLKIAIKEKFPIGEFFTGDELTEKFNSIWQGLLGFDNCSNKQAIPLLSLFCEVSERTSTTRSQKRTNGYKILSNDTLHIGSSPLKRIPSNEPMDKRLR